MKENKEWKDKENRLPAWARTTIDGLRRELERLEVAHALLVNREWFTIPGPAIREVPDEYRLFWCSSEGTRLAVTLYPGDTLLVGRNKARI